ncbi:hypothetical protein D3C72_1744860 [compost metagenome]
MRHILNQRLGHPAQVMCRTEHRLILFEHHMQGQFVHVTHKHRRLLQNKIRTVPWFNPEQIFGTGPAQACAEHAHPCCFEICNAAFNRFLVHPYLSWHVLRCKRPALPEQRWRLSTDTSVLHLHLAQCHFNQTAGIVDFMHGRQGQNLAWRVGVE